MSEHGQATEKSSIIQQVSFPFTNRSCSGTIDVILTRNTDAQHGQGFDLILPSIPPSSYPAQLFGFPTMTARITYAGPSAPHASYAQLFGWIQFVKSTPNGSSSRADDEWNSGQWEMDLYPFAKDLKTPFCFWGHNPTAFDAPCRLREEDGSFEELEWRAQSYLCVLQDAGMNKKVQVLEGAAFEWGFDIEKSVQAGHPGFEKNIVVKNVERLVLGTEWPARLDLLQKEYPEWSFSDVAGT